MNNKLIIISCLTIFYGSAGAMSVSMASRKADKMDAYDSRLFARKVRIASTHNSETVRFIERLLEQVKRNEIDPIYLTCWPLENDKYFSALNWAVANEQDTLLKDLLDTGANPNYGEPKLLEVVERKKVIELLLEHNADPKLCKESVLVKPMLYYLNRETVMKFDGHLSQQRVDSIWDKRHYLMDKACSLITKLLAKGADPNVPYKGDLPLSLFFPLLKKHRIDMKDGTTTLIKRLVWAGADPELTAGFVESFDGYWASEQSRRTTYAFMRQERNKHQAVRLLLIGNRDEESNFSRLPRELIKEIGILVKNGFEFRISEPAVEQKPVSISEEEQKKEIEAIIRSIASKMQAMPPAVVIPNVPAPLPKKTMMQLLQRYSPLFAIGIVTAMMLRYEVKKLKDDQENDALDDQEDEIKSRETNLLVT